MAAPALPWITETKLTGRTRHRRSALGKMVLQVEERHQRVQLGWPVGPGEPANRKYGSYEDRWRDASFDDWHELYGGAEATRR